MVTSRPATAPRRSARRNSAPKNAAKNIHLGEDEPLHAEHVGLLQLRAVEPGHGSRGSWCRTSSQHGDEEHEADRQEPRHRVFGARLDVVHGQAAPTMAIPRPMVARKKGTCSAQGHSRSDVRRSRSPCAVSPKNPECVCGSSGQLAALTPVVRHFPGHVEQRLGKRDRPDVRGQRLVT